MHLPEIMVASAVLIRTNIPVRDDDYNYYYRDSLQSRLIQETGHSRTRSPTNGVKYLAVQILAHRTLVAWSSQVEFS